MTIYSTNSKTHDRGTYVITVTQQGPDQFAISTHVKHAGNCGNGSPCRKHYGFHNSQADVDKFLAEN